jgi:hypothetical protein
LKNLLNIKLEARAAGAVSQYSYSSAKMMRFYAAPAPQHCSTLANPIFSFAKIMFPAEHKDFIDV